MAETLGPFFVVSFFVAMALEAAFGTRKQPRVRWWRLVGVAFFGLGAVINGVLPAVLTGVLAPVRLVDTSSLGTWLGAGVVFLATTFADYWLHRGMHRFDVVFRWAHQLHHAAERVDIAGFAVSSPLELLLSVLLSTIVSALLGATADAPAVGGFAYFLTQLFLHLDVNTPRWIGVFLQRPEAHRVHHTRGVHAYNYGLPLWDALFGTFRNPPTWEREYGFWDGGWRRMGAMLVGRDVTTPPSAR